MELQCPIDPLPQIVVANRHELAEPLPPPLRSRHWLKLAANAAVHVAAAREQCDARRFVERFQAADDGQQLEPARARARFDVGGGEKRCRRRSTAARTASRGSRRRRIASENSR